MQTQLTSRERVGTPAAMKETVMTSYLRRKTFATAAALVVLLLLAADGARAQIAIGEVSGSYPYATGTKKFHGYVVFVEQPASYFTPLVTNPAAGCPTKEAPLLTTSDWAQQVGAFVAINASFGDPEQEYKPGDCRYVFGPVKSNGVMVAFPVPRPDGYRLGGKTVTRVFICHHYHDR